jgi:hypothetical protein
LGDTLDISSPQTQKIPPLRHAATKPWLVNRFDREYITGDEAKTNRKLIYSTFAVRALEPESGVKTLVLGLKSFEPPDFVEDVVNQML